MKTFIFANDTSANSVGLLILNRMNWTLTSVFRASVFLLFYAKTFVVQLDFRRNNEYQSFITPYYDETTKSITWKNQKFYIGSGVLLSPDVYTFKEVITDSYDLVITLDFFLVCF